MKVDTTKKGLVRGYIVYSQWRAGCIGIDEAKDDNNVNVGIAYTMWHRLDDDDVQKVEMELEALLKCYEKMDAWDGAMLGFEYRDFSK